MYFYSFRYFSSHAGLTKYVPEDEYLMHNYKIESEEGDFDKKELDDYIKQKPNKRIIFWRFYLSLYNLSSPGKDNGFQQLAEAYRGAPGGLR